MIRICAFVLVLLAGMVSAAESLQMDVSGTIAIDKDGNVYDYEIGTILTPEVKQLVEHSVRRWRFEPVLRDGKAVYAKSQMHLTLTALPVDKGYQLRIDNVLFAGSRKPQRMVPPEYPREAMRAQIDAYVLVAMQIDADGKVIDAIATQSELPGSRGPDRIVSYWRKQFEAASVKAARQWRFQPADPAAGDLELTTMIIPISFQSSEQAASAGHRWRSSPTQSRKPIPWLPADKQHYDASGLKDGQSLALDGGLELETAVVGTTL